MNTLYIKQEIALGVSREMLLKKDNQAIVCKGLVDSCLLLSSDRLSLSTTNGFVLLVSSFLQKYGLGVQKSGKHLSIEIDSRVYSKSNDSRISDNELGDSIKANSIDTFLLDMSLVEMSTTDKKRVYLSAVFLGSGSFSMSRGYHLQFALHSDFIAKAVQDILFEFDITSKLMIDGTRYTVYIKDSQLISDVLVLLGATQSALDFNNILVNADVRKNSNRATNCITANIDKTIDSSQKYIRAIEFLKATNNFDVLSLDLKATASMRLKHPEHSLEQLAKLLEISKSGLKHRLDKILQIKEDLDI